MHTGTLRLAPFLFCLSFLAPDISAGCLDSVHLKVVQVQCHGMRNGVIEVTEVFGGTAPFYFSLDGQSYSTRPVFDLLWAGEYQLYVRDSTGCVEQYPILLREPEELRVQLSLNDSSVLAGEWVQIIATVYPAGSTLASIEWRPPGMFAAQNQLIQTVRMLEETEFYIEIRNAAGCTARDFLTVPVEETSLYFPNAFNPQSLQDNYFTLFAGQGVARVVRLQVFNRGGNMVYERRNFVPNDPAAAWDGKWGSRTAPAGVYSWVAEVEFINGKRQHFSGNVTLING